MPSRVLGIPVLRAPSDRAVVVDSVRMHLSERCICAERRAVHSVLVIGLSVQSDAGSGRLVHGCVRPGAALPVWVFPSEALAEHPRGPSTAGEGRGRDVPHQPQHPHPATVQEAVRVGHGGTLAAVEVVVLLITYMLVLL